MRVVLAGAREEDARFNLAALLSEAGFPRALVSPSFECGDGRWSFRLRENGREVRAEVPGCSLDEVKGFTGTPFVPRLYVGGESWTWGFAVSAVRIHLSGKRDS